MAVLIATNLRKELSGSPLFDGVSFKLERRDRLALAGANGAGKTTLLRALQGEITLEGGELAWERGTRVALHDQRPPALSHRSRTCCCSTSRRTTSTSSRSSGSKSCCARSTRPSSSSRTTAGSSRR